MNKKLDISEVLACADLGIKEYWDALPEESQKHLKQSFYVLNRYMSNVIPPNNAWSKCKNPTLEEQMLFIMATNERYNKHFFLLQNHPKLLWLLVSSYPLLNNVKFCHQWIPMKQNESKKIKILEKLYPTAKLSDIRLLEKIISDDELKKLINDYGEMSDKSV